MIQAGSRTPKPIIMTSQHSANVFTANFSCDNQYIYSGGKEMGIVLTYLRSHNSVDSLGDDSELIKHDFKT